jgi:hypothetical protein
VRYKLGFYISDDSVLHSPSREDVKSYIALTDWGLYRTHNVSPVRYELGFYISDDSVLHSPSREDVKSYIALTDWGLYRTLNMSPVRYELGFYTPDDGVLHSHRRENLKSYIHFFVRLPPDVISLHINPQNFWYMIEMMHMTAAIFSGIAPCYAM